jgi:hypothetical protein
MKKPWVCLVLFFTITLPIVCQQNALLDRLLDQREAGYAEVVYMTLSAAGLVQESATPAQAVEALTQLNWKIAIQPADTPISLGRYSELLMKAFDLHGGILYGIFKGPRYACRELAFLKIISSDARPNRTLSGEEAVRILGNLMGSREGRS